MKSFTSILESLSDSPEKRLLSMKIQPLKDWLYKSNGLDLNKVILSIFKEQGWVSKLGYKEVGTFQRGLELLKLTSLGESYVNQKVRERLPNGIESEGFVKTESGDWDFVNKLNTNYSDLADLLSELVMRGMESNMDKGKFIYDAIIADPMKGLLILKPSLKRLLEKYFKTLDEFRVFTKNTRVTTKIGEVSENNIIKLLLENDFEIKYQGGNGDFIDMIFGCDIITWREDFGYKIVQVKNKIYWDNAQYYNVDWIGEGSTNRIFNKNTKEQINFH